MSEKNLQERIFEQVRAQENPTISSVADRLGVHRAKVCNYVHFLIERGELYFSSERVGVAKIIRISKKEKEE